MKRIAAALVLTRSVGSSTREIGVFRYLYSVVRRMRFRLRMRIGDMVEFAT